MRDAHHIELRALLPEGAILPSPGTLYELLVDGKGGMTIDDPAALHQAVTLACRLRRVPEPRPGDYVRMTLCHAPRRVVHVGRLRWTDAEVTRWTARSAERLAMARQSHGWPAPANAEAAAPLRGTWEGSNAAA